MSDFDREEFDKTNVHSRVEVRRSLLDRAWKRGMEEGGVETAKEAQAEMRQTITNIALKSEEEGRKVRGLLDAAAKRLEAEGSRATVAFNMVAEMEGREDRILKTDVFNKLKEGSAANDTTEAENDVTPQEVEQYMLDNGLDYIDEEGIVIDYSGHILVRDEDKHIAKEVLGIDMPESGEGNDAWVLAISDMRDLKDIPVFEMK
ncbi:MAG: hypothetical protein CL565_00565 [Alphaproteobacteria bacterium]|nr:hypothetical protein [Alphaproteobacteria bacterium]|tara:strand:- start:597 stop:1208 length:612 start_codon:yes stop_codon:yes gene_type:complete